MIINQLKITAAEGKAVFVGVIEGATFDSVEDLEAFFTCIKYPKAGYDKYFIELCYDGLIKEIKYYFGPGQPTLSEHIEYYSTTTKRY